MTETPPPKPEEKTPPPPALPYTPPKAKASGHMRLINLAVLGFIGYAGLTYFSDGYRTPEPQPATIAPAKETAEIAASHASDPRIDRLRRQEKFNLLTQIFPASRPASPPPH